MKNFILLLAFSTLAFTACNKENKNAQIDVQALQAKLRTDPDVAKARDLFFQHARILASFSPDELKVLHNKVGACGLSISSASSTELMQCLENTPGGADYAKCELLYEEYSKLRKGTIEQRYPEFTLLESKVQSGLLLYDTDKFAKDVLSDHTKSQQQ
jgi:hypothetical protein